jgi:hypothetical protein
MGFFQCFFSDLGRLSRKHEKQHNLCDLLPGMCCSYFFGLFYFRTPVDLNVDFGFCRYKPIGSGIAFA